SWSLRAPMRWRRKDRRAIARGSCRRISRSKPVAAEASAQLRQPFLELRQDLGEIAPAEEGAGFVNHLVGVHHFPVSEDEMEALFADDVRLPAQPIDDSAEDPPVLIEGSVRVLRRQQQQDDAVP